MSPVEPRKLPIPQPDEEKVLTLAECESAVRDAVHSAEMESLSPTPALSQDLEEYASGKIEVDELLARVAVRHPRVGDKTVR